MKSVGFPRHTNIPSASPSDVSLVAAAFDREQQILANLDTLAQRYATSHAKKSVGNNFERFCVNDSNNLNKPKQRFKYILNSRLTRGLSPYQYNGTQIQLVELYLEVNTNIRLNPDNNSLNYERAFRFTLVYFPLFEGRSEKIPSATNFFSGPDVNSQQYLHSFFSSVNPVFWDSSIVLWDQIVPLGCMTSASTGGPRIVRSNGNFFFSQHIDLTGLHTRFYVDSNITDPDLMYQNISTGLLVLYVQTDFLDNQSKLEELSVNGSYRLTFVDE